MEKPKLLGINAIWKLFINLSTAKKELFLQQAIEKYLEKPRMPKYKLKKYLFDEEDYLLAEMIIEYTKDNFEGANKTKLIKIICNLKTNKIEMIFTNKKTLGLDIKELNEKLLSKFNQKELNLYFFNWFPGLQAYEFIF